MQVPTFSWPTKEDYDMAMQNMNQTIQDVEVSRGNLQRDNTGILRYGGAGLYVVLYHIDEWMIRCFCKTPQREPPNDILQRYRYISEFTQQMRHVPALIPITYVDQGIQVDYIDRTGSVISITDTKVVPFIKMPFISGLSLGNFILTYRTEQHKMEQLCQAWRRMINDLEMINMAHGDLDLTNVMVTHYQHNQMTLKVIDYDNTWIPPLARDYNQTEGGHEHFQHPAFSSKSTRAYNANMDRFSALTIYISLKALAHRPDLFKEYGSDDTHRLLFAKSDYDAEIQNQPNTIRKLRELHLPDLDPLLDELCLSLKTAQEPRSLKTLLADPANDNDVSPYDLLQPDPRPFKGGPFSPMTREDAYFDWDRLNDSIADTPIPSRQYLPQPVPSNNLSQTPPWTPQTHNVQNNQPETANPSPYLPAQTQMHAPAYQEPAVSPSYLSTTSPSHIGRNILIGLIILGIILALLFVFHILPPGNTPSHSFIPMPLSFLERSQQIAYVLPLQKLFPLI